MSSDFVFSSLNADFSTLSFWLSSFSLGVASFLLFLIELDYDWEFDYSKNQTGAYGQAP
jgi:hypothetical protein